MKAIDEAHCISEWGHAFRPDYLKVARFTKEINAERVVCLTATATPRVAQDICKAFDIDETDGLFRTTTYRPNLHLLAECYRTKDESYPRLMSFLKDHSGPTIIYITQQKQSESLAEKLKRSGFNARHFHAGIKPEQKTMVQESFMASNNMVVRFLYRRLPPQTTDKPRSLLPSPSAWALTKRTFVTSYTTTYRGV